MVWSKQCVCFPLTSIFNSLMRLHLLHEQNFNSYIHQIVIELTALSRGQFNVLAAH